MLIQLGNNKIFVRARYAAVNILQKILSIIFSQPSNQMVMELNSDRGKNIHFVVRLCSDALWEVIYWGDRRKLTSLEKLGKRFHLLIDGWFEEVPFLRLDLRIRPLRYIFVINKVRFLIL